MSELQLLSCTRTRVCETLFTMVELILGGDAATDSTNENVVIHLALM